MGQSEKSVANYAFSVTMSLSKGLRVLQRKL